MTLFLDYGATILGSLCAVWWAAGLLGGLQSRRRRGRPFRFSKGISPIIIGRNASPWAIGATPHYPFSKNQFKNLERSQALSQSFVLGGRKFVWPCLVPSWSQSHSCKHGKRPGQESRWLSIKVEAAATKEEGEDGRPSHCHQELSACMDGGAISARSAEGKTQCSCEVDKTQFANDIESTNAASDTRPSQCIKLHQSSSTLFINYSWSCWLAFSQNKSILIQASITNGFFIWNWKLHGVSQHHSW